MKLSVVIAAYNERENVVPLTERLVRTLDGLGADWELLYVVEGTDGTREALDALARDVPRIKVLYGAEPSGLGAAFRRGFAAVRAGTDLVLTMDADLNHQPEEIPLLLSTLETSGADIVVGSRFVHGSSVTGIPLWKRALSTSMNATMRFLWGLRTRDKTSGFRVYRAHALRTLAFRNDNFAFLPSMGAGTTGTFDTSHDPVGLAPTVEQLKSLVTTDSHITAAIDLGHDVAVPIMSSQQVQAVLNAVHLH